MTMLRTLGILADIVSIFAAVFAFGAWWQSRKMRKEMFQEQQRLQQPISVTVKVEEGKRELQAPGEIRRGDLSRGEVLGAIGMLPMKVSGQRFELGYLNTRKFFDELRRLQKSEGERTLEVLCSDVEFKQFKTEALSPGVSKPVTSQTKNAINVT